MRCVQAPDTDKLSDDVVDNTNVSPDLVRNDFVSEDDTFKEYVNNEDDKPCEQAATDEANVPAVRGADK